MMTRPKKNKRPGLIRRIFNALRYTAARKSKHTAGRYKNDGKRNEKKHTARRFARMEAAPREWLRTIRLRVRKQTPKKAKRYAKVDQRIRKTVSRAVFRALQRA